MLFDRSHHGLKSEKTDNNSADVPSPPTEVQARKAVGSLLADLGAGRLRRLLASRNVYNLAHLTDDEVLSQLVQHACSGRWKPSELPTFAPTTTPQGGRAKAAAAVVGATGGAPWRPPLPAGTRQFCVAPRDQAAGNMESPETAVAQVEKWLDDAEGGPMVRQMYESVYGELPFAGSLKLMPALTRKLVLDQLFAAFRTGKLIAYVPTTGGATASEDAAGSGAASAAAQPAKASSSGAAPVSQKPVKTWFSCQLLDEDGEPMVGEDYVLDDSDGCHREGKLDANGRVEIPSVLSPGDCKIKFPNIHLNYLKKKKK